MKYKVMREHEGDKPYFEGDTRELNEVDALQLVHLGVLTPIDAPLESPLNKATKPPKVKDGHA